MSLHTGLDQVRALDAPNFSIGHVLVRSFWTLAWNLFSFAGMTLVIALPVGAAGWLLDRYTAFDLPLRIQAGQVAARLDAPLTFVGCAFVCLLAFLMIQAAVAYRTFRSLAGYPVGFDGCLIRSLAVMLQLVALIIVASIVLGAFAWLVYSETSWLLGQGQLGVALFFGFLLLDVLLFILVGCWAVFPAIAIERVGPVAAILRSWRLTRGRRWQILVLLALFVAVGFGLSLLFGIEFDVPYVGAYVALGACVPFSWLGAVVLTTSYYHLVGEKDGIDALGRIFA